MTIDFNRAWPGPSSASIGRQCEASRIVDLIAFVGLIAQKLLQGGSVPNVQRDSIQAWADRAHDWLQHPDSGFAASMRMGARRGAERFIEPGLRGMQLVPSAPAPRALDALTEIAENPDSRD